jgi:hypothetical protein
MAILAASSCSSSAQATVECLYENLLDRAPTSSELAAGASQSPFTLFTSLLASAADYINSLYVTTLYYLLLERAPRASELATWVGVDKLQIIENLTGSAEFLKGF